MTKRGLAAVLFVVAISGTAGCNRWIDIQDGQLSDEMLQYARPLVGEYAGQFAQSQMTLELRLSGRKLELVADGDLAGAGCESHAGGLLAVSVEKSKGHVHVAEGLFAFNPGKCSADVEGREILVTFDKREQRKMDVSLLQKTVRELDCSDPAHFGRCVYRTRSYYLEGTFRGRPMEETSGDR